VAKEGQAVYCATKSGGEMFFATLARESAQDRCLRVVTVRTPAMDTAMQTTIRAAVDLPGRGEFIDRYRSGRLAAAADVAHDLIARHLGASGEIYESGCGRGAV
jgi:NAD(P)-dependent dehydrogenase (short-subunit alcohol dehydrogenase family)